MLVSSLEYLIVSLASRYPYLLSIIKRLMVEHSTFIFKRFLISPLLGYYQANISVIIGFKDRSSEVFRYSLSLSLMKKHGVLLIEKYWSLFRPKYKLHDISHSLHLLNITESVLRGKAKNLIFGGQNTSALSKAIVALVVGFTRERKEL